jgi:hypothetical protein
VADLSGFDANNYQPNQFDVLPAGEYEVVITDSKLKPTSNGAGEYLELVLQVLSGDYQNRKVWDRLNIKNPSAKAQEIARGTLSAICRAVGVMTPHDSSELHGKPLLVKLVVKSDPEFGDKNEVKAYKPRHNGNGNAYSAPAAPTVQPTVAAPTPEMQASAPW